MPLGSTALREGAAEDPESQETCPGRGHQETLEEGKAPMFTRLIAVAAVAAVAACAPALAAPVTVQLRVEGSEATLFEGPVTTDGKAIDKGDGPHPCDGTAASPAQAPGPTMTAALDDASIASGFPWEATWFSFGDFLITRVGSDASSPSAFWGTVLNYEPTQVGGCWQQVREADDLLFAFGDIYTQPLLKLSGPVTVRAGQSLSLTVTDGKTGAPVQGASVAGRRTLADGRARVLFDSPGLMRLKAEKPNAIRSSTLAVCVAPAAGGDCGVPVMGLGSQGSSGAVDSRAPSARISGPRNGRRYARGPRLLRGTARDDGSGVSKVELSLRRRAGRRCSQWSGRRERFVGRTCRKASFFDAGTGPNWSYLLPSRLPAGRYVLDVKAVDRAGNTQTRFVRGRSRAVFEVVR